MADAAKAAKTTATTTARRTRAGNLTDVDRTDGSMAMTAMKVRIVVVPVTVGRMDVPVRMGLPCRPARLVRVVVMRVEAVEVLVGQRLVNVLVRVPPAEVQPLADEHQQAAYR
jgi:hypothetical protein